MINEETIKMLKEISDECKCRNAKALKYHIESCEECPYYLPNMPDDECLFYHAPCAWDDYLKIIIERNSKQEESKDGWCNTCKYMHHKSECLGCAKYDEYDNLITLSKYESEVER